MKRNETYRLVIEIILIITGLFLFIQTPYYWLGVIFIYLGVNILVIDRITKLIVKKRSLKILGLIFLIITGLNMIRHFDIYFFIIGIGKLFDLDVPNIKDFVWLVPSVIFVLVSIRLIIHKTNIGFEDYLKRIEFKLIIGFIFLMIILDFPIFNIPRDMFGGLHGHPFWDSWVHIH